MAYFEYGQKEITHLKKQDKKLGAAIDAIGPLTRNVEPDVFPALVGSIISQQISGKAADTVFARLKDKAGILTPTCVDAMSEDDIQQCGTSRRKAGYIKGVARAATDGAIDFNALHALPDDEIIKRLTSLHGVGVWTAEMLLIFSIGRPDVVSFGDLGIRRGMMNLYGLEVLNKADFMKYRAKYTPYGSVASFYLWALAETAIFDA